MSEQQYTGSNRPLEWYGWFVYPNSKSYITSMITLIHIPFMLAFLSFGVIGTFIFGIFSQENINYSIFFAVLLIIALLLYAEHAIDDTSSSGKPWQTRFSDNQLMFIFFLCVSIGIFVTIYICVAMDSFLPLFGYLFGIFYIISYGAEIWKFHTVEYGASGMASIAVAGYISQGGTDLLIIIAIFIDIFINSYFLMSTYQSTKSIHYKTRFKILGIIFLLIYFQALILTLLFFII